MAEASHDVEGPDFEKGCEIDNVPDEGMLSGARLWRTNSRGQARPSAFRRWRDLHTLRRSAGEGIDGRLYCALPVAPRALRCADGRSDCGARIK